jgi:hypothetical protein
MLRDLFDRRCLPLGNESLPGLFLSLPSLALRRFSVDGNDPRGGTWPLQLPRRRTFAIVYFLVRLRISRRRCTSCKGIGARCP